MIPHGIAKRTAAGLHLAAAPTFGLLALLTGGGADMLCMGGSPFGGMSLMYGLMCAFHLAPWLKLFARRRTAIAAGSLARG